MSRLKTGPKLKICSKCGVDRATIGSKPTGCKLCYEAWYRLQNRDKLNAYGVEYRAQNVEKIRQQERDRYKNNPMPRNSQSKAWAKRNLKNISKRNILKRRNVIQLRIKHNLKQQFFFHLKNSIRFSKLTSCSIDFLKKHIESQFKEGMSWANYGLYGWHIDHIKPVSRFDLTSESEIKAAWHYTNLQPLWAEDNLRKGSKYEA